MIRPPTQCEICAHRTMLDIGGWACAAFPAGIPEELQSGQVDHRQPVDGDRGIQFTPHPKWGTEKMIDSAFNHPSTWT